jgi:hypothetical protein
MKLSTVSTSCELGVIINVIYVHSVAGNSSSTSTTTVRTSTGVQYLASTEILVVCSTVRV